MNAFDSDAPVSGSMRLPPNSTLPSPAKISDPARTLLVVEDDPMVRHLLTELLSCQGYQVLPAENPKEALRVASVTATIHLLLADFSLSGSDGVELTRNFRAVHPKTPVLMVAGAKPQNLDQVAELGPFEILRKPFELDELFHKVRALVEAVAPLPLRPSGGPVGL